MSDVQTNPHPLRAAAAIVRQAAKDTGVIRSAFRTAAQAVMAGADVVSSFMQGDSERLGAAAADLAKSIATLRADPKVIAFKDQVKQNDARSMVAQTWTGWAAGKAVQRTNDWLTKHVWSRPAEGLKEAFTEKRFNAYIAAYEKAVPKDDREDPAQLSTWLQNPEDPLNVVPVVRGDGPTPDVVGGLHINFPGGKGAHLEYIWGADSDAINAAAETGCEKAATKEGIDSVYADVPVNAPKADEMRAALKERGFFHIYTGLQPCLEEGGPETPIEMYARTLDGKRPSPEDIREEIFEHYWPSFAPYEEETNNQKLAATEAYKQMTASLNPTSAQPATA